MKTMMMMIMRRRVMRRRRRKTPRTRGYSAPGFSLESPVRTKVAEAGGRKSIVMN